MAKAKLSHEATSEILAEGLGELGELLCGDDLPDGVTLPPEAWKSPAAEADRRASKTIELPDNLRHVQRVTRHRMEHALHVANAAKQLKRLPKAGEVYHCVMRGNYNGWDIVPAILRLAAPAKIAELWVATLSFNTANADELLALLDSGDVGRVHFLCSVYFQSTSATEFSHLAEGLLKRGQRVAAARCHAKILAFHLTSGARLVVESSANLRSCRNVEQFTLTRDKGVYDFHAAWIGQILEGVA